MIAVIDYGMGNLHSVSRALERMGFAHTVTSDPETVEKASGIILPGVGAFGDAMRELSERRLDQVIKQEAFRGKPLLGICLGMQLLFTGSEEHEYHQGLNLLPGRVVRLKGDFPIPHMGWNSLRFPQFHPLLYGLEEGYVYFVHSYHVLPDNREDILAVTDYYGPVTAIVGRNRIFGTQFHPEKSGSLGRELLRRFAALCESEVGVS